MNRLVKGILTFAALALLATPALSQDRPRQQRPGQAAGFMPALGLLGQASVQKELKMTDDQIAKGADARKKQEEAVRGITDRRERAAKSRELDKESDKLALEILKPEQGKRLSQILLQQRRSRAMTDEAVVKQLTLNDEQKKKIADIQEETGKQRRELFGGGGRGEGGAENRAKIEELTKATDEKCLGLLNEEQKAKWKEMLGEPFKGEITFAPARRQGGDRPNRNP